MVTGTAEYHNFDLERKQIAQDLAELKDKSTKGTIDEPIRRFLDLINVQPDWISTSTCSGRLVSYLPGPSAETTSLPDDNNTPDPFLSSPASSQRVRPAVNGKGGGTWLFVSHSTLETSQLSDPIKTLFGGNYRLESLTPNPNSWRCDSSSLVVHFVYQPPVFHLLVRSVAIAVPILTTAIGAGFRNSGITIGHRGRVILAIRASTGGLDVPIAIKIKPTEVPASSTDQVAPGTLQLLVSLDYLSKLLLQGNQLMQQNEAKLQRLFDALSTSFHPSKSSDELWESAEDRRQRMRSEGLAARASQSNTTTTTTSASTPDDDDLSQLSLFG
ncbi:hypothetical protein MJO28_014256 [Puccinia striiformis f. sp. tritici]|uniref:Uncharacterized protein n=1 Tax=Puccinia striiformis f. sp. tritici TaxID=168172 RepID=A0ACC0DT59_9BASI|nr:hypothetical protein Pst134EA_026716 [Puccinia striiformis f. sp. tritici]KAH9450003.1 hypothetical protein Pst134EA_026716 [Puccinia striiformis f. sp. tritici]KAI7938677.1 hypothetical protein MJO28_014256 [Puccinia striiformis f. sp. tritici]KAI7939389.1 hypothetical protein MJO29_014125 [Puccinia striiformis f. sp. tritici]